MGGARVQQVAIRVKDIEGAKPFYRDLLGLVHQFDAPSVSAFAAGDTTVLLIENPDHVADDTHGMAIYFAAAPIEERYAALKAQDAVSSIAPHVVGSTPEADVLIAFVRDPSGNAIGLIEHRPSTTG